MSLLSDLHSLFFWLCRLFVVAHGIFDLPVACKIFRCGVWDLVPWPGRWDLGLLHWEHVVLATGPPGRSLNLHSFLWKICSCLNCCFPVSNTSFFWMLSRFFHFLFVFRSLIMMYHGLRFLSAYPVWSSLIFLNVRTYVFCQIWDVFRLYVLKSFPPQ